MMVTYSRLTVSQISEHSKLDTPDNDSMTGLLKMVTQTVSESASWRQICSMFNVTKNDSL